jgi:hypothetical protein
MSATDHRYRSAVAWRLKVAEMTEQEVNSFIEFLNERRGASSPVKSSYRRRKAKFRIYSPKLRRPRRILIS